MSVASMKKWGIPPPKRANTPPEITLLERLVWVRYKGTHWWPALLYHSYTELQTHLYDQLDMVLKAQFAMAIMRHMQQDRAGKIKVARLLGRSALEVVEVTAQDPRNPRNPEDDPNGYCEFYWQLPNVLPHACDVSLYGDDIELYLDFHRALDQVEDVIRDVSQAQFALLPQAEGSWYDRAKILVGDTKRRTKKSRSKRPSGNSMTLGPSSHHATSRGGPSTPKSMGHSNQFMPSPPSWEVDVTMDADTSGYDETTNGSHLFNRYSQAMSNGRNIHNRKESGISTLSSRAPTASATHRTFYMDQISKSRDLNLRTHKGAKTATGQAVAAMMSVRNSMGTTWPSNHNAYGEDASTLSSSPGDQDEHIGQIGDLTGVVVSTDVAEKSAWDNAQRGSFEDSLDGSSHQYTSHAVIQRKRNSGGNFDYVTSMRSIDSRKQSEGSTNPRGTNQSSPLSGKRIASASPTKLKGRGFFKSNSTSPGKIQSRSLAAVPESRVDQDGSTRRYDTDIASTVSESKSAKKSEREPAKEESSLKKSAKKTERESLKKDNRSSDDPPADMAPADRTMHSAPIIDLTDVNVDDQGRSSFHSARASAKPLLARDQRKKDPPALEDLKRARATPDKKKSESSERKTLRSFLSSSKKDKKSKAEKKESEKTKEESQVETKKGVKSETKSRAGVDVKKMVANMDHSKAFKKEKSSRSTAERELLAIPTLNETSSKKSAKKKISKNDQTAAVAGAAIVVASTAAVTATSDEKNKTPNESKDKIGSDSKAAEKIEAKKDAKATVRSPEKEPTKTPVQPKKTEETKAPVRSPEKEATKTPVQSKKTDEIKAPVQLTEKETAKTKEKDSSKATEKEASKEKVTEAAKSPVESTEKEAAKLSVHAEKKEETKAPVLLAENKEQKKGTSDAGKDNTVTQETTQLKKPKARNSMDSKAAPVKEKATEMEKTDDKANKSTEKLVSETKETSQVGVLIPKNSEAEKSDKPKDTKSNKAQTKKEGKSKDKSILSKPVLSGRPKSKSMDRCIKDSDDSSKSSKKSTQSDKLRFFKKGFRKSKGSSSKKGDIKPLELVEEKHKSASKRSSSNPRIAEPSQYPSPARIRPTKSLADDIAEDSRDPAQESSTKPSLIPKSQSENQPSATTSDEKPPERPLEPEKPIFVPNRPVIDDEATEDVSQGKPKLNTSLEGSIEQSGGGAIVLKNDETRDAIEFLPGLEADDILPGFTNKVSTWSNFLGLTTFRDNGGSNERDAAPSPEPVAATDISLDATSAADEKLTRAVDSPSITAESSVAPISTDLVVTQPTGLVEKEEDEKPKLSFWQRWTTCN